MVWRGLERVARGVVWAGGRGTRCGGARAWHGVWVGLEGVARGVEEAGQCVARAWVGWRAW